MANEYKTIISDKKKEANKLMTDEQIAACNLTIHTASVAAGTAGAIPVPVADAVPISGAQVAMAIGLGKIFDQKLTDSAAKALIGAAASTFVGRNLVKLIPVAGWIASAAVADGVTEAIGWTLAVDFAKTYQVEKLNNHNSDDEANNSTVEINNQEDTDVDVNESYEDSIQKSDDESLVTDFESMFEEDE